MFSIAILSPPFYPTFTPLFAANSRKYQQQSKKAILLLNEAQALLIWAFFDKTSLWEMVGLGGLEPPTSPLSGLHYIRWGAVGLTLYLKGLSGFYATNSSDTISA